MIGRSDKEDEMPWFPDFVAAAELARQQTRAAGKGDPVGQYLAALNRGDTRDLETVWPGHVVVYDPHAGVSSKATDICGSSSNTANPCSPRARPVPRLWPQPSRQIGQL